MAVNVKLVLPILLLCYVLLVSCASTSPAQAYMDEGYRLYEAGQFEKAIEEYTAAIALKPQPDMLAYALGMRGAAYFELGDDDKALEDINASIKVDPNVAGNYAGRGHIYLSRDQWNEAVTEFSKAIELGDTYPLTFMSRGVSYLRLDRLDLALADYKAALELNPNIQMATQIKEAIARIELDIPSATPASPTPDANTHLVIGFDYYNTGQFDEARDEFALAIELNPSFVEAYLGTGHAEQALEHWEDAVRAYDRAIELDPNLSAATYVSRGSAYLGLEQWQKAIMDLDYAIELESKTPSDQAVLIMAYKGRAYASISLGNPEQARQDFETILALDPNHPEASDIEKMLELLN